MRLPSRLGNRTKRLITEQLLDTEGLAHHQRLDLVHALLDLVVYDFLGVLALHQKFDILLFVALRQPLDKFLNLRLAELLLRLLYVVGLQVREMRGWLSQGAAACRRLRSPPELDLLISRVAIFVLQHGSPCKEVILRLCSRGNRLLPLRALGD